MANTRENPYVGPRAFTLDDKEKLFGRDRDITAIYRLLIAERIVLLFSPSGAGKTSLVQAGLLPRMKDKGFDILPVIRVSQEIPDALKNQTGINRYVLSVIQALEEDKNLPAEQRLPDDQLAAQTLPGYFSRRLKLASGLAPDAVEPVESDHNLLLVFDQFEEILTFDPNDRDGKWEFFRQLGDVLNEKNYWALFVIREDYVAALDPYLKLIPSRLATTYRLDLLDFEAAQQAIRKPAALAGVEYDDDAAEKLVNDLRSVRVQKPDGSWEAEPQLGRYVEPVQLQVVCYRLWGKIEATQRISAEQIESLGNVNEALAGYYADQVQEAAQKLGLPEKDIRTWFENQLITRNGIRSQVMFAEGASGGLSNQAVLYLERTHLIRGETRRGVKWYELAHDRLIVPIRANNKDWFLANLSTLQRQAMLWEEQGHPDHLLLRDNTLLRAEKWAENNPLTEIETQYLKACQDLRNNLHAEAAKKEAETQRQRAEELGKLNQKLEISQKETEKSNQALTKSVRDLRIRNIIAFVLLAAAIFLGVFAFAQMGLAQISAVKAQNSEATAVAASTEAINQKKIAVDNAKLAQEQKDLAQAAQTEAEKNAQKADEQAKVSFSSSLAARASTLIDRNPPLATLLSLEALNFANQTKTYQPVAEQNLRDLLNTQHAYVLSGHAGAITNVIFSGDGNTLITADTDADAIHLWNLNANDPSNASHKLVQSQLRAKKIKSLAISPDNRLLAIGSKDTNETGEIGVVFLNTLTEETALTEIIADPSGGDVTALAFGKRGDRTWLAAGSSNGRVVLIDVSPGVTNFNPIQLAHGVAQVNVLTFSADGHWLTGGSTEGQLRIWDVDQPEKGPATQTQNGAVNLLAYSPDGKYLVGAGDTKEIYIYNAKIRENQPVTLTRDIANVKALAFDPVDPRYVAVGYQNGTINIWNIASSAVSPVVTINGHMSQITHLVFSSDGQKLVSTGTDMALKIWDMGSLNSNFVGDAATLQIFNSDITSIAFSPNGRWLAAGTADHKVYLWDFRLGFEALDPITFGSNGESYRIPEFSPDGNILAARKQESDQSLTLDFWNTTDYIAGKRQPLAELKNTNPQGFSAEAYSPDGKLFAIGAASGGSSAIKVYDLTNLTADPRTLAGGSAEFAYVGFSPDGKWLVACDIQGNLRFWNAAQLDTPALTQKINAAGLATNTTYFTFSSHGRWLLDVTTFNTDSDAIQLWDMRQPQAAPLAFSGTEGGVDDFTFSPDERWLVVGTIPTSDPKTNTYTDGQAYLWDLSSVKPEAKQLTGHSGYVNGVTFNAGSNLLATGDDAGYVRIWDVTKLAIPLAVIHFSNDWVVKVAFSPDGHWLAAGSADGSVGLWETQALSADPSKGFYALNGHEGPITDLTFSPNNQWLATGSSDKTIRLWRLNYPRSEPVVFHSPGDTYLFFEPQMRFLVSSTYISETNMFIAQLWRLNPEDLHALACQAANRNMTEDEWLRYMPSAQERATTCPQFPLP